MPDNDDGGSGTSEAPAPETLPCVVCGSTDVHWIKCKLICLHCRTILMSCEDI